LLKPGGYFEITETEINFSDCGPNFTRMMNIFVNELEVSDEFVLNLERIFLATGQLTNIQQEKRVTKLGPSGGFTGELYLSFAEEFFNGSIGELVGELMAMSQKEYKQFWQQCKTECIELGTGVPIKRVWGQKKYHMEN
ncbi:8386_t:CDS:2, partial [Ambispora leptoticha]